MSLPPRAYAQSSFGQVHFCDTGGSGAALLLLHQAPLSLRQFSAVYAPLADAGLRAIGVDLPGFGASDPAGGGEEAPPTVEQYAEVVPAVLDHLGITRAHLCIV